MKELLKYIFLLYLVISMNTISLMRKTNPIKSKHLKKSVVGNRMKKANFSSTKKVSFNRLKSKIIPILIALGAVAAFMIHLGAMLISAIGLAITTYVTYTTVVVGLIAGGMTFGALTVKALADARKKDYAHKLVQFFNNQIEEKGRLCYVIKTIHSVMDDQLEVALFKNQVNLLFGKKFLSEDTEVQTSFLEQVSGSSNTIHDLWESNKDFETMVCTKTIDLIGETRFIKNRVAKINPKVYSAKKMWEKLYDSFNMTFKVISPFWFKMFHYGMKIGYKNPTKALKLGYANPDEFATKIFDEKSSKDAITKKLGYQAGFRFKSQIFTYEFQDFKYYNVQILTTPSKNCGNFDLICFTEFFLKFIPGISSNYGNASASLVDNMGESENVGNFVNEIRSYAYQVCTDAIFMAAVQANFVLGFKDILNYLIKAHKMEGKYFKDEPEFGDFTLGNQMKSDIDKYYGNEILAEKEKEKIAKVLKSGIIEYANQIEILTKDLHTKSDLITNSVDKTAVIEEFKSITYTQISKLISKVLFAGILGFGTLQFIFFKMCGYLMTITKAEDLQFFELAHVYAGKIMDHLPVLGMIYFIRKTFNALMAEIQQYRVVDKEVTVEETLLQNYNILLENHVDYLIPKYLMSSIRNMDKLNTLMVRNTLVKTLEIEADTDQRHKFLESDYKQIIEELLEYIKERCRVHANFYSKYFNAQFFKDAEFFNEDSQLNQFVTDLNQIYHPLLIYGPITDLVVVSDNLLNSYGFAKGNPGYRMYRGGGKQFGKNHALLYCRGCYSPQKMYLSYIYFDKEFDESKIFDRYKNWFGGTLSSKKGLCNDIDYIDNTMSEKVGSSFKYSYLNACYKKVENDPKDDQSLIRSIYSDQTVDNFNAPTPKMNINTFLDSQSNTFKIVATSVSSICNDNEQTIATSLQNIQILDYYAFKSVNAPVNCVLYVQMFSDRVKNDNNKLDTIIDNFILDKLNTIAYNKEFQAFVKQNPTASESDIEKLNKHEAHTVKYDSTSSQIKQETYLDGQGKTEGEFQLSVDLSTISNSELFLAKSVQSDIKTILKKSIIDENFNSFTSKMGSFAESVCEDGEFAEIQKKQNEAKIKYHELLTTIKDQLKCEAKLYYEAEDESKFFFKLNENTSSMTGYTLYDKLNNALNSLQKEMFFKNTFDLYRDSFAFSDLHSGEFWKSTKSPINLEQFKNSFQKYELEQYGSLNDLNPVFLHFLTANGKLPEHQFSNEKVKMNDSIDLNTFKTEFDSVKVGILRILFPVYNPTNPIFRLKNLGKVSIKMQGEGSGNANGSIYSLVIGNSEEDKASNKFSSFEMDDMPIDKNYFVEFYAKENCSSYNQNSLDTAEIKSVCNFSYFLSKSYIPYFPRYVDDGESINPPGNMMFLFPHKFNLCFGFRLWIKMNYDDLKNQRDQFCKDSDKLINHVIPLIKKKKKITVKNHKSH